MANPDPEIPYDVAMAARPDAIVATGRSDYPNQVNNVLGFPFIFRGALDVRATTINDEMKLAATHALADLAKEDVPDSVLRAYGVDRLEFGREYIIPKPFDPRVLIWEASAVAQAAMETGVAQTPVDLDAIPRGAGAAPGQGPRDDARHDPQGAARSPSAWSSPRARRARSCAPARSCWTRRSPTPSCWATRTVIRARDRGAAPAPGAARRSSTRASLPRLAEYAEEFYQPAPAQGRHPHRGRASSS